MCVDAGRCGRCLSGAERCHHPLRPGFSVHQWGLSGRGGKHGIRQSVDSGRRRCHDNARCESMWARMESGPFYDRIGPAAMTVEQSMTLIWRYSISYWNRRRICSANDGLPPVVKRQRSFAALDAAAQVPQIFERNVSTDSKCLKRWRSCKAVHVLLYYRYHLLRHLLIEDPIKTLFTEKVSYSLESQAS